MQWQKQTKALLAIFMTWYNELFKCMESCNTHTNVWCYTEKCWRMEQNRFTTVGKPLWMLDKHNKNRIIYMSIYTQELASELMYYLYSQHLYESEHSCEISSLKTGVTICLFNKWHLCNTKTHYITPSSSSSYIITPLNFAKDPINVGAVRVCIYSKV